MADLAGFHGTPLFARPTHPSRPITALNIAASSTSANYSTVTCAQQSSCYATTLRYKARASIFLFHLFRNLVYSCFGSCAGFFAYLEIRLNAVSQQLFWKLHRNKMSMAGSRKRPSAQSIIFKFIGKHTDTLHNAVNFTISTCRFRDAPESTKSKIFWGACPQIPLEKASFAHTQHMEKPFSKF